MSAFRLALVGAPNSGKSTLFNGLTGGRAKVANYAGVTVERRSGMFKTPEDRSVELIDLPIMASNLNSRSSPPAIFYSNPLRMALSVLRHFGVGAMAGFIRLLREKYGSAEAYLLGQGVTAQEIASIRALLAE